MRDACSRASIAGNEVCYKGNIIDNYPKLQYYRSHFLHLPCEERTCRKSSHKPSPIPVRTARQNGKRSRSSEAVKESCSYSRSIDSGQEDWRRYKPDTSAGSNGEWSIDHVTGISHSLLSVASSLSPTRCLDLHHGCASPSLGHGASY